MFTRHVLPSGVIRLGGIAAIVLAFASASAANGFAEPRASGTHTSAFADTTRPVTFLREMVVTGTRFPRAYYQSPQSLSFINGVQLRETAPTVVGDVLSMLPGVDMSKDSPWEQRPVVRGLSGQRVLVLMDGTPMNSARGNGPHPSLVDPSQIERIEVVRGPSSVAYGSDALGGVINIITRDALPSSMNDRSLRGSLIVGGSTAENQTHQGITLMPHIGKLSAFLGAGMRGASDYRSPLQTVVNSGFSDNNYLANLRYDFTERLTLRGGLQRYHGADVGVPGLDSNIPLDIAHFSFPFYDRDFEYLALDHSYPESWLAKTHIKVYRQREHRDFYSEHIVDSTYFYGATGDPYLGLNRTFNPAPGRATGVYQRQDRYFDLETWGSQIQLTSRKTDHYLFTMGLDGVTDRTKGNNIRFRTWQYDAVSGADSAGVTSTRVTQSLPTGHFDNYGAFFQNEWFLTSRWSASVGARWTQYHYKTDLFTNAPAPTGTTVQPRSVSNGAGSGSIGLVYALTNDLRLTANVANGYREPNAQDLFFNGPGSVGTVLGNPDLKSERSMSYDGGVRWSPYNLALAANAYYSTYDDLINALPFAPGTYKYTNIATATIYGGELEAEYRFLNRWTARTTLSDQVGDITSSSAIQTIYGLDAGKVPLELVPPFKGTTSLRWTDPSHTVWIEGIGRYAWRTHRLPPPIPGVGQLSTFKKEYVVGDVMLGATLQKMRVQLGVRNVTDRRYRPALASVDDPGVSMVGGVTVDF
jgi:hemoglobin/transferrin/lactoferrin receptor protein